MKLKDTIRSIFRSRWVSGISDSISTKIIAICLLWCPIMLHPAYNYCSTGRICTPLCQQVPYCTLSCKRVYAHKYPKRLYIWNGALYNKREVLRHAAQAACPSEKQMLDIVLNGNTVFFCAHLAKAYTAKGGAGVVVPPSADGMDGRGTDRRRIFKP